MGLRDANTIYAHSIGEEGRAHPIVPRGFNVVINSGGSPNEGLHVGRPLDESDVIGVPLLTPTYSSGLWRERSAPIDRAPDALRIIAQTQALARDYYVDTRKFQHASVGRTRLNDRVSARRHRVVHRYGNDAAERPHRSFAARARIGVVS